MVKWSIPAKLDLKRIYDYIAQDSTFYARKVADEILDKSVDLLEFPEIGRKVPEVDESNIREVFVYSYRLIYELDGRNIHILAVIHCKRDLTAIDLNKPRE